jgi:hypothetical protein
MDTMVPIYKKNSQKSIFLSTAVKTGSVDFLGSQVLFSSPLAFFDFLLALYTVLGERQNLESFQRYLLVAVHAFSVGMVIDP